MFATSVMIQATSCIHQAKEDCPNTELLRSRQRLIMLHSVLAVNDVGSRRLAQELSEAAWNALRNLAPDSLEYLASQADTSKAKVGCDCQAQQRILECRAIAGPLRKNASTCLSPAVKRLAQVCSPGPFTGQGASFDERSPWMCT